MSSLTRVVSPPFPCVALSGGPRWVSYFVCHSSRPRDLPRLPPWFSAGLFGTGALDPRERLCCPRASDETPPFETFWVGQLGSAPREIYFEPLFQMVDNPSSPKTPFVWETPPATSSILQTDPDFLQWSTLWVSEKSNAPPNCGCVVTMRQFQLKPWELQRGSGHIADAFSYLSGESITPLSPKQRTQPFYRGNPILYHQRGSIRLTNEQHLDALPLISVVCTGKAVVPPLFYTVPRQRHIHTGPRVYYSVYTAHGTCVCPPVWGPLLNDSPQGYQYLPCCGALYYSPWRGRHLIRTPGVLPTPGRWWKETPRGCSPK